jgi:hypothetical protein
MLSSSSLSQASSSPTVTNGLLANASTPLFSVFKAESAADTAHLQDCLLLILGKIAPDATMPMPLTIARKS